MHSLWDCCLRRLAQELPAQQFTTWIRPLAPEVHASEPGALVLVAPNRFVLELVRERFASLIKRIATEARGQEIELRLVLARAPQAPARPPAPVSTGSGAGPAPNLERARLNPAFTFDSFVTGKANQLARAAAVQVAENPGISYNPLFIYGGVGLGKTHLVQAIGNALAAQRPQARIRYSHAEQYVTDVVRAYQQKSFDEFKRYYHSLDLLLIDDIQFFSNKDRTQEEFFYAFNALVEAHKQIVITCDTYPKEIAGMQERLISRFGWGLTVAIEAPELEMRVAIVLKKAEAEGVALHEDIAFFVAKHVRSNVRELEGALKKVFAFARFTGRELSLDLAREALRDILNVANRQITVEGIQKTVADYFKIKPADMHSKRRTRNIARPRQVAMALAKDLTQMSLPEIGEAFGNRDHTTVLHACRTVATLRKKDLTLNRDYHVLEQTLKG
ncbi:MAG: chromosomal replication initiation protein DnaA [Betaproteobacteria bacterium RIFCSPLOWO2_02_67_12]|nr:MAG: chromosomal replication initiation protein DnaA [Betaproteobacteria bacterium RIFCSPLOWO2_02_67_12]OGA30691.1 MAG: chromosomal replication initiation protein DnaA [Betaproteobacteria bacterium RIFCSPLOWO2_02_FULL_68_150]